MPTVLKFVFTFRSTEGYGWTETHFRLSPSDNPNLNDQLDNAIVKIAPFRAAFLGASCAVTGIRVSYPRVGAIASQNWRQFWPGPVDKPAASQNDSLATIMKDGSQTKKKIIHVRGPWKEVVQDEEFHPEGSPLNAFLMAMQNWQANLIGEGYGWLSKDTVLSTKGTVLNYVQNVDDTVTFQVAQTLPFFNNFGSAYFFNFSRINRSQSVLNRTLLCNLDDATNITTINPIAVGPFSSKGRYILRVNTFVAYATPGPISLGERRMGKVSGLYPGRRRARPLV